MSGKANTAERTAFVAAWMQAHEDGLTSAQLADKMGNRGVREMLRMRRRIEADTGKVLPSLGAGKLPGRIDQVTLTHYDWTAERCLEELQRVQAEDETRWLTARYFAHHTGVRDTTWNQHFGTFEEYCRQAGMGRIRQQSQFGKQIAKHVSVDHYRERNIERGEWADRYLRPAGGRYQTILGANDLHDKDCDPFWLRVFLDTAQRVQPDIVCLNGDVFDLPEFGKYQVDPRTWDVNGRIRFVHDRILAPLREVAPDAQLDIIEGNHEFRLVRHMADASPAMMALLSELHGMSVADLFGLPKYQCNYIAKADLAAYRVSDIKGEVARNWRIYFDTVLACHFPEAASKGHPGWNGHHHSHIVRQFSTPTFGVYEWHQVGSGHRRDATYCNGEKWGNGFILWHVDTLTRSTIAEYIPVTDFAVVGGRYYHRSEAECWNDGQRASLLTLEKSK